MSQYPSPYSPPPYPGPFDYYQPYGDGRGPAKRASILMIVLGALMLAMGLCIAGAGQMLRSTTLPPELLAQVEQMEAQSGVSLAAMTTAAGIVLFLFAVVMILLGIFVRRGTMAPVVVSLVVTGVATVLIALLVLFGMIGALMKGGPPQALLGLCMWIVPLALLVLVVVWLIQAARAAPRVRMMQQQYAQQMWQYQQTQQAPYGYAAPPTQAGAERSAAPDISSRDPNDPQP